LKESKMLIYDKFLELIPGCGPKLSGMLIAEVNPYRAPNISSVWRFFGLDVASTGRGRGVRKDQHELRWMRIRKGEDDYEMKQVELRTYDAKRKSKLVATGMESIMKQGFNWATCTKEEYDNYVPHLRRVKKPDKEAAKLAKETGETPPPVYQVSLTECPYCLAYFGYRHRLQNSENLTNAAKTGKIAWKDTSDMHRHQAARRYMAKMFLKDLWICWRMIEGLPLTESYEVAKLGHRPHHEESVYVRDIRKLVMEARGLHVVDAEEAPVYRGEVDMTEVDLDPDTLEVVAHNDALEA